MAVATNAARQLDDDAELVARTRAGDERAFGELFARYRAPITAFLAARLRDHGRAEEVAQDVFVSALRAMRRDDRPIAFRAWIYEIARNACIDAHRRSRGTEEVPLELGGEMPFGGSGPEASLEAKQRLERLQGAFDGLNETHHQVLVLREFEGRSYREIGERLGMTRPSVESALFRARRRLETEYGELESGERCREVQASLGDLESLGARGRARAEAHLTWCPTCRQVAGHERALRRGGLRRKVAALLPLPAFLRERWAGADGALGSGSAAATHGVNAASGPLANTAAAASQSLSAASTSFAHLAEPAAGWAKAAIAAAVVTVGGVGATATTSDKDPLGLLPGSAVLRDADAVLPESVERAVSIPFGDDVSTAPTSPPGVAMDPAAGAIFRSEDPAAAAVPVVPTPFGPWPADGPLVDPALSVGGETFGDEGVAPIVTGAPVTGGETQTTVPGAQAPADDGIQAILPGLGEPPSTGGSGQGTGGASDEGRDEAVVPGAGVTPIAPGEGDDSGASSGQGDGGAAEGSGGDRDPVGVGGGVVEEPPPVEQPGGDAGSGEAPVEPPPSEDEGDEGPVGGSGDGGGVLPDPPPPVEGSGEEPVEPPPAEGEGEGDDGPVGGSGDGTGVLPDPPPPADPAPAEEPVAPPTGDDGGLAQGPDGAPGASGHTPAATGEAPGASGETPAATGEVPGASGETPAATGEAPGASGETPAATGEAPGASGETPAATGVLPGVAGDTPAGKRKAPRAGA